MEYMAVERWKKRTIWAANWADIRQHLFVYARKIGGLSDRVSVYEARNDDGKLCEGAKRSQEEE